MARPRKDWRAQLLSDEPVVTNLSPVHVQITVPPSCASCIYRRHNGAYDECRRYPVKVTVSPDNWCGEFKS